MKATMTATAAFLLSLAACGGEGAGDANNSTVNQAETANAAAPAVGKDPTAANAGGETAPAAAEAGARATASSPSGEIRALLIGRWTDNGDCAAATDFGADGTFTSPAGAGRWTLEREYLTLATPGAPDGEVAIQVIDGRAMETVSPMGRIGRWTRC